jgi:hypothetical protein
MNALNHHHSLWALERTCLAWFWESFQITVFHVLRKFYCSLMLAVVADVSASKWSEWDQIWNLNDLGVQPEEDRPTFASWNSFFVLSFDHKMIKFYFKLRIVATSTTEATVEWTAVKLMENSSCNRFSPPPLPTKHTYTPLTHSTHLRTLFITW